MVLRKLDFLGLKVYKKLELLNLTNKAVPNRINNKIVDIMLIYLEIPVEIQNFRLN